MVKLEDLSLLCRIWGCQKWSWQVSHHEISQTRDELLVLGYSHLGMFHTCTLWTHGTVDGRAICCTGNPKPLQAEHPQPMMLMCLHPESDPQLSRLAEADNARESLHANQVHKKLVYQPEMRNTDYWHPLSKASFFFFFFSFLSERILFDNHSHFSL